MGFSGVQNFPTVGLIDKNSLFRRNLEETGMGYDKEVEMIRMAHELDMLTTPYVFDEEDIASMIRGRRRCGGPTLRADGQGYYRG
jgi:predicted TIM-barrel enzyme